eukprot:TRINITY_DN14863_c0_g1_i1.p1 TRINITY_DN14863_c0_g1~~TRINITY_DN14863_c0_g1_i1.p1  ORF type:complete len:450 (-),score=145.47 TRINITY_DN14863_c0_g1_i1:16-1365(-)
MELLVWTFLAAVLALVTVRAFRRPAERSNSWSYDQLAALASDELLPAMFVDVDAFRRNVRSVADVASRSGKTIRLATKSVRVPELIQLALSTGGSAFRGLMCFSTAEVSLLAGAPFGFDDFLLAYPLVQREEFETIWRLAVDMQRKVCLMVDCERHVELLEAFWRDKQRQVSPASAPRFRLCVDVDMSYRLLGGRLHLGAHRSPVHDLDDLKRLVNIIGRSPAVELVGIMTYEAQIAGVPDRNPFVSSAMNAVLRLFKAVSARDCTRKRAAIAEWLRAQGIELEFFNGGGTGSLSQTAADANLTEVTVGSGLLQSGLFDYFHERHTECAFAFGLRVTREPMPGVVTCHSGGFIASGSVSGDKAPAPFMPAGVRPFDDEGFGEVQTPLRVPQGVSLRIGDPVFFRPAKAGEIAEHFNEYLLFERHGEHFVTRKAKTYRGLGANCFETVRP